MKKIIGFSILCLMFACTQQKTIQVAPTFPLTVAQVEGNYLKTADGQKILIPGLKDSEQSTLFLVRHAEKQKGKNPKLTAEGTARAKRLSAILDQVDLEEVCSSKYQRTMDTGKPSAAKRKLDLNFYNPRKQDSFFETYQTTGLNKNVLVVGHSNTIPSLLNYLTQTEKYENLPEDRYNRLYIVSLTKVGEAEVLEVQY